MAERVSAATAPSAAAREALVHQPRLLLADEPTGNLDQDTGAAVLALMESLCRRDGLTLIMATHSREVAAVADRVLQVEHGKLVSVGEAVRRR